MKTQYLSKRVYLVSARWQFLFLCLLVPLLLISVQAAGLPQNLPDLDNSDGFILDFSPGDHFETLMPLFLVRRGRNALSLAKPGMGAPLLEQYEENPEGFDYVVRLIPAGSSLQVLANKDGGLRTCLTYVRIEGTSEWTWVDLDERVTVNGQAHLQYNREYFRKLEVAEEDDSGAAVP